jgi:hypothetical protein
MKKIFTLVIFSLMTMTLSACNKAFAHHEHFETMLLTVYESISIDGRLEHTTASNNHENVENILDEPILDVSSDDVILDMIYGSHSCYINPSQDMTYRCDVTIIFEGTPTETSQFDLSK